jgi:hypothetical protein
MMPAQQFGRVLAFYLGKAGEGLTLGGATRHHLLAAHQRAFREVQLSGCHDLSLH